MRSAPEPSYLHAPITRRGLAGLEINDSVRDAVRTLGRALRRRKGKDVRAEAEILEYRGVTVILERGKIRGLLAEAPYRGETPDRLRIGMPWTELRRSHLETFFDDERIIWRVVGWPSLEVGIARPRRWGESSDVNWVDEFYEVTDPDRAFIVSLAVTAEPYE